MKRMLAPLCCFSIALAHNNASRLLFLAKDLLARPCNQTHQHFMQALKQTKNKDLTCDTTLIAVLKALLSTPSHVKRHATSLDQSFSLLDVPGYKKILRHIALCAHDESLVKGAAFEIDYAVQLQQAGDTIKQFQRKLCDGHELRVIDIYTESHMIECKNINWERGNTHRLKNQFSSQKRLVEYHNDCHNEEVAYQVSSKQPIPVAWKQWFDKHHIAFQEEQN